MTKLMTIRRKQAQRKKTQERIGTAEIVNVNGSPYYGNGYVWVRFVGGAVSSGNEVRSAPVFVRQNAGASLIIRAGRLVHVRLGYDGKPEIVANDHDDLVGAGVRIASLNYGDDRAAQTTIEQLNNLKSFANSPADDSIQVVPTIYQKANGDYNIAPQAFDVDLLTSHKPADVDNQVVVCVWLNTDTNTYETSASSALSQSTDLKANSSSAITYINEAKASAPSNYIGVWSYVIKGDTATVTDANMLHDLRGIISEGTNSSAAQIRTITSTYTITQDAHFIAPIAISGSITISGSMVIL